MPRGSSIQVKNETGGQLCWGHPRGLLEDGTPRCPPRPSFRGLHAWMSSDGGAGPRGSVPGSALCSVTRGSPQAVCTQPILFWKENWKAACRAFIKLMLDFHFWGPCLISPHLLNLRGARRVPTSIWIINEIPESPAPTAGPTQHQGPADSPPTEQRGDGLVLPRCRGCSTAEGTLQEPGSLLDEAGGPSLTDVGPSDARQQEQREGQPRPPKGVQDLPAPHAFAPPWVGGLQPEPL